MKTFVASAIALLLGLAAGWYGAHRQAERETGQVIQQMMEPIESSDREHASRAVRAIDLIESGKTAEAVHLLSKPIAYYYNVYKTAAPTDRDRQLRTMIEQLAGTNATVAEEIHTQSQ